MKKLILVPLVVMLMSCSAIQNRFKPKPRAMIVVKCEFKVFLTGETFTMIGKEYMPVAQCNYMKGFSRWLQAALHRRYEQRYEKKGPKSNIATDTK